MTDITTRLQSMSEAMWMDRSQEEVDALLLEAKGEIERLREGLGFYADELTWADTNPKNDGRITVLVPVPSFAEIDRGKLARETLAPSERKPDPKPFTFKDPVRQAEWERQRKERGQ